MAVWYPNSETALQAVAPLTLVAHECDLAKAASTQHRQRLNLRKHQILHGNKYKHSMQKRFIT